MTKFEKTLCSILMTMFLWAVENYSKTASMEREYKSTILSTIRDIERS